MLFRLFVISLILSCPPAKSLLLFFDPFACLNTHTKMPERDVSFFTVKGGESWKRIFTRTCSCHVLLDSIREFAVHELSSLLSAAQQDIRDELNRLEAEEEERQRLEEERLVLEAIENENQLLHALEKNEEEKEKEEEEKRRLEEEKMKEKEKETITSTSRRGMSRRKMNKSSSKSDVQTKREKEKAQKEQELKEKREREEKEAREKAAAEHKESLIQAEKKISQELIEVSGTNICALSHLFLCHSLFALTPYPCPSPPLSSTCRPICTIHISDACDALSIGPPFIPF